MKRIIAVFFALCLAIGGAVSALAAEATDSSEEKSNYRAYYNGSYKSVGGKTVDKIKKGTNVWLDFTVVDKATVVTVPDDYKNTDEEFKKLSDYEKLTSYFTEKQADYIDADSLEVAYSSTTLPKKSGSSIGCVPSVNKNGELCFTVTIPVYYIGTGTGSCEFDLSYVTYTADASAADGKKSSLHRVTVSQTIDNCEPYVKSNDDDDDETNLKPLTPYIIVSNYSYGGSSVTAGSDFNLSLTLRNTSSDCDLENIVTNLSPMGVFSVASSSNTIYLESLPAGGETTFNVTLKAGMSKVTDDEDTNCVKMSFRYQYTYDDERYDGSSDETITIPVDYPDRFELGMLESNDSCYVGEDYSLYLPMVNKGRSSVYNLSASVECDGAKAVQSQYIGNLAAGTESGADFTLTFQEAGEYAGKVIVTYEDANMTEHTVEQEFSVDVESMGDMSGGDVIDDGAVIDDAGTDTVETGMSTRTKVIIGCVAAAVVIAVVVIIRKKRKAKDEMEDEEI